jgi:hypothetical protein
MRNVIIVIGTMLLASGCATPQGGALGGKIENGTTVTYALPSTSAKVSLDLVLEACPTGALAASPTVTITPVANAGGDKERFTLSASDLGSWTQKRDLTVELYENGTLKSVNAGASDRSGAILTNIVKIFAAVAALSNETPAGGCTAEISKQVDTVSRLKAQIDKLRTELPTTTAARTAEISKALEALTTEVARLRSGPLHLVLEDEIILRRGVTQGHLLWKAANLAKWTGKTGQSQVTDFAMDYCVLTGPNIEGDCVIKTPEPTPQPLPDPKCPDFNCAKTIVIRQPIPAKVALITIQGSHFQNDNGPITANKLLKSEDVQVSQFGDYSYVPLTAGPGGAASLAVGLDPFNKVTSYTFKSEARAENLTGSAAGILEAAKPLKGKTDLEVIQAQSADLEERLKLNKLKLCEEVIRAGGTVCPGDKPE